MSIWTRFSRSMISTGYARGIGFTWLAQILNAACATRDATFVGHIGVTISCGIAQPGWRPAAATIGSALSQQLCRLKLLSSGAILKASRLCAPDRPMGKWASSASFGQLSIGVLVLPANRGTCKGIQLKLAELASHCQASGKKLSGFSVVV